MDHPIQKKNIVIFLAYTLLFSCTPPPENHLGELQTNALNTLKQSAVFMESISTEGGFLWRYSTDLNIRAGEEVATPTQIWVQNGTPDMGMFFLRAFDITNDKDYLENAKKAAMALVKGQLQSGGWGYLIEFDPDKRKGYQYREDNSVKGENRSTYDDDNTQSALRFLMSYLDVVKDGKIQETVDYGLAKLIESQYPIGAWPQRWSGEPHDDTLKYPILPATIPTDYPRKQPDTPYYSHYTFNDNAHRDLVMTLLQAWKQTGTEEYLNAAKRGADFLLYSQLPEPQPAWAQQYDSQMKPAWARAFEPPSLATGETTGIMRMLVDLYLELGDEKYLEPLPGVIDWFRRSEISDNLWARMYELSTNKPIYGDRDKIIHYTLEEISEERRSGYRWQGDFDFEMTAKYYEDVKKAGREKWLNSLKNDIRTKEKKLEQQQILETRVKEVISSLDDQNRWISTYPARRIDPGIGEWISTRLYIRNATILCDYLASQQAN